VDPLASELAIKKDQLEGNSVPALLNLSEGIVGFALAELSTYLSSTANETLRDGSVRSDLGINIAMRGLTDSTGEVHKATNSILIDGAHDHGTHATVTLTGVTVSGLDGFTRFELFRLLSQWTFENYLLIRNISIRFELELAYQVERVRVADDFAIRADISDIELGATVLLAIETASALKLSLGQLFMAPVACGFKAIFASNFTTFSLDIANISNVVGSGLLGRKKNLLITKLLHGILLTYKRPILEALPGYAETELKDKLNELLRNLTAADACPGLEITTSRLYAAPTFVNYQKSPLRKSGKKNVRRDTNTS
jgi:hypothetical protein